MQLFSQQTSIRKLISGLLLASTIFLSIPAFAEAPSTVRLTSTDQSSFVEVDGRLVRFKTGSITITSSGYGVGYTRYFTPVFGFNIDMGQLFGSAQGKTSAIITSLGISMRYRPFASHLMLRENATIDGKDFLATTYRRRSEFFLSLGVSQVTVNSSKGALPYNGAAIGIGYEIPFLDAWNAKVMLSNTGASNEKTSINIATSILGIGYSI